MQSCAWTATASRTRTAACRMVVLQVIEAREDIRISPRTQVLAEINCRDHFGAYHHLTGLSAQPWPGSAGSWPPDTLRDWLLNRQREVVYARRQQILAGQVDVAATRPMIRNAIEALVQRYSPSRDTTAGDVTGLYTAAAQIFPMPVDVAALYATAANGRRALLGLLHQAATHAWLARREQLGMRPFTALVEKVELAVIDHQWPNHLCAMDRLDAHTRSGYRRAAAAAFQQLLAAIDLDTLGYVLNLATDAEPDTELCNPR